MHISVSSDVKDLTKSLNKIQKKQIPFALSNALNSIGFDSKEYVRTNMGQHLDRPTPFTEKGLLVHKASKKNPIVFLKFKESVESYLKYQIQGGVRLPKKRAIAVPYPKHQNLNKYGNLPKNKIKTLLSNKDRYFSGSPRGGKSDDSGIFERVPANSKRRKRGQPKIKMLVGWEPQAQYNKRLPFKHLVQKAVKLNFKRRFESALAGALKTAR